jgi:molecular chaperone DnaK (HSP70)
MSTERIVGIDLGTTNSLVAFMQGERPVVIPGEDGLNLVPSVVALDDKDQVIVGNAARKYLIETPERAVYSIKRLMGRGIEDIEQELKLFSLPPGRRSSARRSAAHPAGRKDLSLRRRFPPSCCASSSAMPSDSSMRR